MTTTATPPVTGSPAPVKERKKITMGRVLSWTILALVIFVTMFPFYWMLRTALSNGRSLNANSSSLLPADFTWGAFRRVLGLSRPVYQPNGAWPHSSVSICVASAMCARSVSWSTSW